METVFTQDMTTQTHHMSYCDSPTGHVGVCRSTEDRSTGVLMDTLSERTITITTEQAKAACISITRTINAQDIEDTDTWHGGIGSDLCEFCEALIILRAAAGYTPTDCYRP